jgi:hypothetical protein
VSADRRLRRLEDALPPRIAVRHWLAEAHTHGSTGAYAAWLDEQPPDAWPHRRLRAQAEAAAWAAPRAKSANRSVAAERAGRDAILLVELVAALNERIEALLEPGSLRAETLEAELGLLGLEVRTGVSVAAAPPDRTEAERWMRWCFDYVAWANLLGTADAARTFLEDRYLGMSALFPDLAEDWVTLLARVDELASLAAAGPVAPEVDATWTWPPDRDGLAVITPQARRSFALAHARTAAADLVDIALWRTFRYVGDPEKAQAVQARRLRRATRRAGAAGW